MTDPKSEECCSGSCRSGKHLLFFLLFVIIVLLSGIFYTLQGMSHVGLAGCPMMKSAGGPMCPIKGKMMGAEVK